MEIITNEDKIDYIYKTMKKNQKWKVFGVFLKWFFRLAMLVYIYYFLTVWLPAMIDEFIPKIPKFPSLNGEEQLLINDPEKIKELIKIPQFKELLDSYIKK